MKNTRAKDIDHRIFKKEGEELQAWLAFRKRGGKVPNGKAYTRKEKHKKSCEIY